MWVPPLGLAPTKRKLSGLRRFYLLGETHDSTQVYDIRRSIQGLRQIQGLASTKLWLTAERQMAAQCALRVPV